MIPRIIADKVRQALSYQAVTALIGPRQVGKTSLAHQIAKEYPKALYLDLEDRNDRNRLSNPVLFFESMEDRLIILDEIHRVPDLFPTLRGVIDKARRRKKAKGRFLILGSAGIDLLKQSGESLAGRIAYIEMTPFSPLEVDKKRKAYEQLWLRGGFPNSYLAKSDKESMILRKDFIRTYLERDVSLFGPRIPAEILERLWTMLAHNQACLLNASKLAKSLGLSAQSINRYIDLLSDLFLIRRLRPYHFNIGKRLVKAPKIYIRDSGFVHALLGLESMEQLMGHPVLGMSWEAFVLESLLSILPWRSPAFFYKTSAGAEIDLLIEHKDQTLWAIEIKRSLSPKIERGFYQACSDLKPTQSFIVYAGEDSYPISDQVSAIGLYDMIQKLRKLD
ncbi:MAG: ATP-binding protein [Bdellovibrionaceae bacterium]|nr:ATP-binding protein [Pseudobdellovibrionaceae bacterium]